MPEPEPGVSVRLLPTRRIRFDNFYLGGGFNSSVPNGIGYELMILFNLNQVENTVALPFILRFGITYRF